MMIWVANWAGWSMARIAMEWQPWMVPSRFRKLATRGRIIGRFTFVKCLDLVVELGARSNGN